MFDKTSTSSIETLRTGSADTERGRWADAGKRQLIVTGFLVPFVEPVRYLQEPGNDRDDQCDEGENFKKSGRGAGYENRGKN
jgi:hypothetical protein